MRARLVYWCIAAALVANVALYMWYKASPARRTAAAPAGVPGLVLLSELDTAPTAAAPTAAAQTAGGPAARRAADVRLPAIAGETPGSGLAPEGRSPAGFGVKAPAAAMPSPPAVAETPPGAGRSGAPLESSLRCWLAGPVVDDQVDVELAAVFADAGISMDLILRRVGAPPEYWVTVPTDGTQTDLRRLSVALRENGMESYPINEGVLAGNLSLGLFRSLERAESMQDRLRELGFDADTLKRPRYREEAWIALDDSARAMLGWPAVEGSLPELAGMTLVQRQCPPPGDL